MKQAAVRSQLLRLREQLRAATDGRDLLDRKREAILRAIAERLPQREAQRREATDRLAAARSALRAAQLEIGRAAVDAAALAQPPLASIDLADASIVGVRVPALRASRVEFHPCYGPASGSDRLDAAGAAFARAIERLAAFAAGDAALRRLRAALARTARRLNALDQQLIPDIRRDIRDLAAALEEEERDDAVRRKMWLTRQA